jgi:hypothetical protein
MKLRNKINALVLGFAVLFAAGCGEKDEHQDDPTPVKATQGTCLLTGEGNVRYNYNSQGKLDQMIFTGVIHKDFIYNTEGKMAEIKTFDTNHNLIEWATIAYNSNGLPQSRFTRHTPVNGVTTVWQSKSYYNSANQLIKQTYHLDDTVTIDLTTYSYPGADQVVRKYYNKLPAGGYQLTRTMHAYHDNMKSPDLFLGYLYGEYQHASEHNVVKVVDTDHRNNSTVTKNYIYVYNAEGFPVKNFEDNRTWTYTCQ